MVEEENLFLLLLLFILTKVVPFLLKISIYASMEEGMSLFSLSPSILHPFCFVVLAGVSNIWNGRKNTGILRVSRRTRCGMAADAEVSAISISEGNQNTPSSGKFFFLDIFFKVVFYCFWPWTHN